MIVLAHEKQIFEDARDAVFAKAYRRELQSCSYYYMESLLAEIGRRLSLSLKQVRMMLPEEIEKGLKMGRIDLKTINTIQERQKLFSITMTANVWCIYQVNELKPS